MKLRHVLMGGLIAALVTLEASFGWGTVAFAEDKPAGEEAAGEVLTRGPIHEGFAETVSFDPQPGLVAPKSPPEAIEEVPPDQKPAGDNVAWIPGYWAWDDERDDFLWVSGIWRSLPPGRQWLPGYWGKADDGYQWTSGYWADAKQSEVRYLPEPPATIEAGPNVDAPSANHIWVPGCWVWNENRYAWQPGYWAAAQQNWVWTPAHYQWSPRGYVFVDGYFDYSVARRGVIFAPVYFAPSVYAQQGFRYSPAMAINLAVFGNQLFLRPNYGHYYFGNYYGSGGATPGYYPWFSYNSGGYGYDPFYAQQRWQNRQNPAWAKTVQSDFQHRVDHEDARPPQTLAAQQTFLKNGGAANEKNFAAVTSLDELTKIKDHAVSLQPVTKDERQQLVKQGTAFKQYGADRQKLETKSAVNSTEKPAKDAELRATKLAPSPFLAKASENAGEEHTPPKIHEAPPSDTKVEPKPRTAATKRETPMGKPNVRAVDPKAEPKSVPKVDPKPAPKGEPVKPERPKVEPKPDVPKAEPKPAPKIEPKPAPKVEPKPALPKPMPKAEPKPQPRGNPKSEAPKAGGNDKPGPKDKK